MNRAFFCPWLVLGALAVAGRSLGGDPDASRQATLAAEAFNQGRFQQDARLLPAGDRGRAAIAIPPADDRPGGPLLPGVGATGAGGRKRSCCSCATIRRPRISAASLWHGSRSSLRRRWSGQHAVGCRGRTFRQRSCWGQATCWRGQIRGLALERLSRLATAHDRLVGAMAQAQIWRIEVAGVDVSQVAVWQQAVGQMRETVCRAGAVFPCRASLGPTRAMENRGPGAIPRAHSLSGQPGAGGPVAGGGRPLLGGVGEPGRGGSALPRGDGKVPRGGRSSRCPVKAGGSRARCTRVQCVAGGE